MSPLEIDDLDDEMWAALVRVMRREADAIRLSNTKLPGR